MRPLPPGVEHREVVRALFVPSTQARAPRTIGAVHIVTQADVV